MLASRGFECGNDYSVCVYGMSVEWGGGIGEIRMRYATWEIAIRF